MPPDEGTAVAKTETADTPATARLKAELGPEPFRALVEAALSAIITIDDHSIILYANPATERIFGYPRQDIEGKSLAMLQPERFRQRHVEGIQRFLATRKRKLQWTGVELTGLTKDGREIPLSATLAAYEYGGKVFFSGLINDVSERKAIENELHAAVRRLQLEKQQTPLAAIDWDRSLKVRDWNPAAERIFGYSAADIIDQPLGRLTAEEDRAGFEQSFQTLLTQQESGQLATRNLTSDGRVIHCEWYNATVVDESGAAIAGASLVEDVTERKQMEAQSQAQMGHLSALRTIDLAITASMDLEVTMSVLLDMVLTQLKVDAADILLMHPSTQRLEFAAGRGFRTMAIQRSELRLGECSAGRAALERRIVMVPNLRTSRDFTRSSLLAGEDFEAHYSAPLAAKGKVSGVLEVFHRSSLHPQPDWLRFLETLAGQAAIAVESGRLFADLEKSNLELVLAYDTTLEGWAQALDLRDSVTEGHSRRVTEMTLRLAEEMGFEDAELVHVRRGALLHDIGKMAIPDSILNKNGPLTDDERAIIRRHPEFAFRFLKSIAYLRPAIDIPYCHHERWDGTGYPRGLKEEQIPLAARVFAVVDIWDAITTERPYRQAWSQEKARSHIASLSGSHLDPEVVDVFLGTEWAGGLPT